MASLKPPADVAVVELKRADAIIDRLVRLVKYYGYKEELPRLRKKQRKAAIDAAKGPTCPKT